MTALRQRMLEDMQLRDLAPKTQEAYVGTVAQLAKYFGKSPELLTEEELRQYFLYLSNAKRVSRSTIWSPVMASWYVCTLGGSGAQPTPVWTLRPTGGRTPNRRNGCDRGQRCAWRTAQPRRRPCKRSGGQLARAPLAAAGRAEGEKGLIACGPAEGH